MANSNWSPPRRKPGRASFATHTVIGAIVVLLALFFQVFAPHFHHTVLRFFTKDQHWIVSSPGITLRNPILFHEPQICPKPEQIVEFEGTFRTYPKRSMVLANQAKRVAAEFEFSDDGLNKAVKEFIREMGMHSTMSWRRRRN
ncbi:glucokinase [Nothophoma quercina]|uniref:Glucokinase n=1 Tax=Nothophoma quercina TaxID=749835 RepID=A0ABR3R9I4_9PLEO